MAQTTDGYLWLSTSAGLYRFDGLRFERFQPLHGQALLKTFIVALKATPDGGLWISYLYGGASFIKDGSLTNYSEAQGLPRGTIHTFAREDSGVVWAALGRQGLARFDGARWKMITADWNFTGSVTSCVFLDRSRTLWVTTKEAIFYLRKGSSRFESLPASLEQVEQMAEAEDGTIWMAETSRMVHPVPMPWHVTPETGAQIHVGSESIVSDGQNALWIATMGDGIRRITYPEALNGRDVTQFGSDAERFTQKDGLSSDVVLSSFEDREHNLWFGTNAGLDRFREGPVIPVALPAAIDSMSLVPADDGGTLVFSFANPFYLKIDKNKVATRVPFVTIYSTYRSPSGQLWVGTQSNGFALLTMVGGKFRKVADFPGYIYAITEDHEHRVWASVQTRGPLRLEANNTWTSLDSLGSGTGSANAIVETTDLAGRVWFAFRENKIVRLDGATLRTFTARDGVSVGDVDAMQVRGNIVWIGGDQGLELSLGSHFSHVVGADDNSFFGTTGIAATSDDGLWLSASAGIIHIPESEVARLENDPTYRVSYRLFNVLDGLPDRLQGLFSKPTVIQGTDGILWFSTLKGVVWIDPKHIVRNEAPPPVSISTIAANGTSLESLAQLNLPPRTDTVRFTYTAPSLSVPERIVFRYRLDGQDKAWREAGLSRDAMYTNLKPGSYRFRVTAQNEDGVWNEEGASVAFSIAPAYYQTIWFAFLCGLLILAALWCLYLLRLRQLTIDIRRQLGARLEERERIARELHDTLLQSVQGLMLRFHAAVVTLPAENSARHALERALDRADEVLAEGRQRVRDLRTEGLTGEDLAISLTSYADELATLHPAAFSVTVSGEPRILDPNVVDDVHFIAREAITNAFQHARASNIHLQLGFDKDRFRLTVGDDGHGITGELLARGRVGHFGLSGMRERAEKIGGQLSIRGQRDQGTEVELALPARLAYVQSTGCMSPIALARFFAGWKFKGSAKTERL